MAHRIYSAAEAHRRWRRMRMKLVLSPSRCYLQLFLNFHGRIKGFNQSKPFGGMPARDGTPNYTGNRSAAPGLGVVGFGHIVSVLDTFPHARNSPQYIARARLDLFLLIDSTKLFQNCGIHFERFLPHVL
jgi:hypothetical protein